MEYRGYGSSPRARGTGNCANDRWTFRRFIPACAGNRTCTARAPGWVSVHPRVRGEQRGYHINCLYYAGSSPRARGTGHHPQPGQRRHRFIPACAGNSICAEMAAGRDPVHPRVRGEQPTSSALYHHSAGSSPRARGTGAPPSTLRQTSRFIPACAGNSFPRGSSARAWSVHPRVRGEQTLTLVLSGTGHGSSPRARGTADWLSAAHRCRRFIPACAGNRACAALAAGLKPVHPRVRGEQRNPLMSHIRLTGSSPRARGTGHRRHVLKRERRFIPACAGNRCAWAALPQAGPVHPRVRGEQVVGIPGS